MTRPEVSDNGAFLICTLTCPVCGQAQDVDMPEYGCVSFHDCADCKTRVQARKGECCVFCSYGDVPCPSVQISAKSCCSND